MLKKLRWRLKFEKNKTRNEINTKWYDIKYLNKKKLKYLITNAKTMKKWRWNMIKCDQINDEKYVDFQTQIIIIFLQFQNSKNWQNIFLLNFFFSFINVIMSFIRFWSTTKFDCVKRWLRIFWCCHDNDKYRNNSKILKSNFQMKKKTFMNSMTQHYHWKFVFWSSWLFRCKYYAFYQSFFLINQYIL